jgi:outer membrane protein OmpA-like peptidoglycan-associated protein
MSLLNESAQEPKDKTSRRSATLPLVTLGVLIAAGLGGLVLVGSLVLSRLGEIESQMLEVGERLDRIDESSRSALERAVRAEQAAVEAARGRAQAETDATIAQGEAGRAQEEAGRAQQEAEQARENARAAMEEAERIKQEREEELNRLQEALSQIAETRRTALGLVMNLSSDYLKFDFDKAEVRPENREILSRIAGILLTSKDYQIYVYGHTDNIGTDEYNLALSERRAEAVRDYLVEAGIDARIIDTQGFGKSQPLVPGTDEASRAKNRRVELGIINAQIKFPGQSTPKGN